MKTYEYISKFMCLVLLALIVALNHVVFNDVIIAYMVDAIWILVFALLLI